MSFKPIATYVINLPRRTDRKIHVKGQFSGRDEFMVTIVEAVEFTPGAVGLWQTIKRIITESMESDDEYILICEDDHVFTSEYSPKRLFHCIDVAKSIGADVLLGGVSWMATVFSFSEEILWIDRFNATQFTIVYRKFFSSILNSEFTDLDTADTKLSTLSANKYLIFPFISVQEDFGYSDATNGNDQAGVVSDLFTAAESAVEYIREGEKFYGYAPSQRHQDIAAFNDVYIPTYVFVDGHTRDSVAKQFDGRTEFSVSYLTSLGSVFEFPEMWDKIFEVLKRAVESGDDVVILATSNHCFAKDYCRETFLKNVLAAAEQGADMLSGGLYDGFDHAIVTGESRIWINNFYSLPFLVLYRSIFSKILNSNIPTSTDAFLTIPGLSGNKMATFPFITTLIDDTGTVHDFINMENHSRLSQIFDSFKRLRLV